MTDPLDRSPPRPARDTRADVVRGWLQLSIFASHVIGSFTGAWLIHAAWGPSDSSEQFVFLSGFNLGSLFARRSPRDGWAAAARDMARRTRRLYLTHLVVFALFGATLLGADLLLPGEAGRYGWGFLQHRPAAAIAAALALLYQPVYLDVLPVFIWSMLALPGFAWLEKRVGAAALLAPAALWLAVQFHALPAPDLAPDSPPAFNVFAWQLPFLLGAWAGRRALLRGRVLPPSRLLTVAAVLVVAAGLVLKLEEHGLLLLLLMPLPADPAAAKAALAPARLLHGLSLAWLVARFVPRDAGWMHRAVPRVLACIGRQSLHVFCFGLFLSWGATAALGQSLPARWPEPLLIAAGVGLLSAYAVLAERRARRLPGIPAALPTPLGAAP